jgi:hypothetical protein
MAIVPYSTSVNMGSYVVGARGAPTGATAITGAAWTTGSSKSISSISRANPVVITSNAHGFQNGDFVWISGITANSGSWRLSALNDRAYRVAARANNTFSLETFNGSSWSAVSTSGYSSSYSGGTIRKCLVSDCSVVITSAGHGMSAVTTDTGDKARPSTVRISGVDVFKPHTGEVVSSGPEGIACWFVDTDYNEESFFVRHAYFLGQNDPYKSLKTTLKAEIDAEAWESLNRDTSRAFPKPTSGRIAVKVINHLGDEVMKVFKV